MGRMTTDLILGTAGHIDHGKTSLIKALTGIDTDRLPEEKKRGITIELGFARLNVGNFRFGIVDVPGHERFVRNMLAGATGIDVALLVVAADDSVKPQTREHFDILRLLQLPAGVVALTKCDLADADWIALVEDEVRELVADSFLADAPLVRTSAATGEGLDALRSALESAAQRAVRSSRTQRAKGPFRLPIDRCFAVAGHGTVVTGSIASGSVRLGDELTVEPGGQRVRVRGLQRHDEPTEQLARGQRAAVNLGGIHHNQIHRGHELCTPGHLVPSRWLTVRLELLATAPRPVKNRARVRCHIGTAELMASISLLEGDVLLPGQSMLAQLILSQPAVATWGQGFIIRSQSPMFTIGGGRVLEPNASRIRLRQRERIARLGELESENECERASAAIYLAGLHSWKKEDLARTAGVTDAEAVVAELETQQQLVRLVSSAGRSQLVHRDVLKETADRIEVVLSRLHERQPLKMTIDRGQLLSQCAYLAEEWLLIALLEYMESQGRIVRSRSGIRLAGHSPRLADEERRVLDQLVACYEQSGFQPPSIKEVATEVGKSEAFVSPLIHLACDQGMLVRFAPEGYLHHTAEQRLRSLLTEHLAAGDGLTVSEIRTLLGTTRKYAVPLCEYLDRIGLTRREGDRRVLASSEVES